MARSDRLTFASWNILYDDRHPSPVVPQIDRLDSITESLASINPNIIALYEVEGDESGNNGDKIASGLGLPRQIWVPYGHRDEGIFMATTDSDAEFRVISTDVHQRRVAIILKTGALTVAATHLSWQVQMPHYRVRQTQAVLRENKHDQTPGERIDVLAADWNSMRFQKPRRLMKTHGYESAARRLRDGLALPHTYPTSGYLHTYDRFPDNLLKYKQVSIDDILYRGVEWCDGGLLEGESDHKAIWMTIRSTAYPRSVHSPA